jgi:predicted Zn-dependent protease with MMP-like domain
MGDLEEEYDYQNEIEPDEHTLHENMDRSRYFFAMISFLMALIMLSIYLNNYYDGLSGWFLLFGVFAFGVIGIVFLWPNSILNKLFNSLEIHERNDIKHTFIEIEPNKSLEEGETPEVAMLTSFEQLVREALASIPIEFHEQMENVLVRVQYDPGDEVMDRVGVKEGYTLLGLYEGVPLTAYGQARMPHPEIITIYERSIVEYCHRDPDRIRRQVRHTVLHEVAHHFGIDHEEMPIWIQ